MIFFKKKMEKDIVVIMKMFWIFFLAVVLRNLKGRRF